MMNREAIFKDLLKDQPGIYVEIGTCWGGWAEWLRKNTPCQQLITVDPYKKYPQSEYYDALNEMSQQDMDEKHRRVKARLEPQGIVVARDTSYGAAQHIPDGVLTFCYIDGNHLYHAVLQDLVLWWPKIKKGGYLCGDDVEDINKLHDAEGNLLVIHQQGSYGKYGVAKALKDFAKACPDFKYKIVLNQFIAKKE